MSDDRPYQSEFYLMSDVKERGWTAAMIRDFLGEPDERKNSSKYRGTVYKLYLKERVEKAEKLEEFIVWKEKLDARRIKSKSKQTAKRYAKYVSKFKLSEHWNIVKESREDLLFDVEVVYCGCVWCAEISALGDKWQPANKKLDYSKSVKMGDWKNRWKHSDSCIIEPGNPIRRPKFETDYPQWCAIDVEIACPEENYGSICGIGVAVFDGNGNHINDISREWKVRPPENKYDPLVVKEVRLKPSETAEADPWEKVSEEVASLVGEMPIVFHAAENEMRQMVSYENLWTPEKEQIHCSQRMAHFLFPSEKMGLVDLCDKYNIPIINHHNPLDDARATGWLWQFLALNIKDDSRDVFEYFEAQYLPDMWMHKGLPISDGQLEYLSIITHNTGKKPICQTKYNLQKRLDKLEKKQTKNWNEFREKTIAELSQKIENFDDTKKEMHVSWYDVSFTVPKPPDGAKKLTNYVMNSMSRRDAGKVLNVAVPAYKEWQYNQEDDYYGWDY